MKAHADENFSLQSIANAMPALAVTCAGFLLAGCRRDLDSSESILSPAGLQADRIATLTWIFLGVCVVVFIGVMTALAGALLHRRRGETMGPGNEPIIHPDPVREKRIWVVVSSFIAISVTILFALLIGDFVSGRRIHTLTNSVSHPLRIKVISHQWWWEVRYLDWPERFGQRMSSNTFSTANELHLPVDPNDPVAVQLDLDSADVIHSFWVPSLNGKKDIIPGHPTSFWLRADKPGTYWGECGEYCGYQHAQMRLVVVAEPVDDFQNWLSTQRHDAPDPSNDMQKRGQDVFLHASCAMCHTIQGTLARASVGPDLTHVASRKLLAAGAINNVPGHLAGWVVDPQRIKPGAKMPQNNLAAGDLRALLEYLETLK